MNVTPVLCLTLALKEINSDSNQKQMQTAFSLFLGSVIIHVELIGQNTKL